VLFGALAVACPEQGCAQDKSSGTRLLLGFTDGEQFRWTAGVAVKLPLTDFLWEITTVDLDFEEGEKKASANVAALFDVINIKLPLLRTLGGLKAGPILGMDVEHTDAANPAGLALTYAKAVVGLTGGLWWGKNGLWLYYKGAKSLDPDATTTPLKPSWGLNLAIAI
jgi:hypothetical protein